MSGVSWVFFVFFPLSLAGPRRNLFFNEVSDTAVFELCFEVYLFGHGLKPNSHNDGVVTANQ